MDGMRAPIFRNARRTVPSAAHATGCVPWDDRPIGIPVAVLRLFDASTSNLSLRRSLSRFQTVAVALSCNFRTFVPFALLAAQRFNLWRRTLNVKAAAPVKPMSRRNSASGFARVCANFEIPDSRFKGNGSSTSSAGEAAGSEASKS